MQSDQVGYWICNAIFCVVVPLLIRNPAWVGRVTEWLRERLNELESIPVDDEPTTELDHRSTGWQVSSEVAARRAPSTGWVSETIDVGWR